MMSALHEQVKALKQLHGRIENAPENLANFFMTLLTGEDDSFDSSEENIRDAHSIVGRFEGVGVALGVDPLLLFDAVVAWHRPVTEAVNAALGVKRARRS